MTYTDRQDVILRAVAQYPAVASAVRRAAPASMMYGVNAVLDGVRPPWSFDGPGVLSWVEGAFARAGVALEPSPTILGTIGDAIGVADSAVDAADETAGRAARTAQAGLAVYGVVSVAALYFMARSGILREVGKGISRLVRLIP